MVLKVAITGNIASGKSQVEKIVEKYFCVYDTYKIAHNILNEIKDFYGYDVFTEGIVDRKKLGSLVFKNPELKEKLEKIVHPKVKDKIVEIFEKHKNDKAVFISVPLLFEAGFEILFDKIILVKADENIRLKRLMERYNFSEAEAISRIKSQISQEEKTSDYVIENNSSFEELEKQTLSVLKNLSN